MPSRKLPNIQRCRNLLTNALPNFLTCSCHQKIKAGSLNFRYAHYKKQQNSPVLCVCLRRSSTQFASESQVGIDPVSLDRGRKRCSSHLRCFEQNFKIREFIRIQFVSKTG